MGRFLAVLAVFLVAHVLPVLPAIRRPLQARLRPGGFLAAYSALSLLLFAWLISAALAAPYIPLWFAGPWAHGFAVLLAPVALVLLGASALAPNPLSIAFVNRPFDPVVPGAVAITRHPILWGLGLWGLAHVPANGHLVGLTMFGSLGVFAFIGMAVTEGRRRKLLGEDAWLSLAAPTSVVPFAALLLGRARWPGDRMTMTGAALGLLLAGLLLAFGHAWLFGRDPLAGLLL